MEDEIPTIRQIDHFFLRCCLSFPAVIDFFSHHHATIFHSPSTS